MSKKTEVLNKKLEALQAEVAHSKMIDQRCDDVRGWKEFEIILTLPDSALRPAFAKIAADNSLKY